MQRAPESLSWCFEFAGRVQRVDVDDDEPGAEDAAHRDRVLQDIRQHDRDALAARRAELLLQVAGELHRQPRRVPHR